MLLNLKLSLLCYQAIWWLGAYFCATGGPPHGKQVIYQQLQPRLRHIHRCSNNLGFHGIKGQISSIRPSPDKAITSCLSPFVSMFTI